MLSFDAPREPALIVVVIMEPHCGMNADQGVSVRCARRQLADVSAPLCCL